MAELIPHHRVVQIIESCAREYAPSVVRKQAYLSMEQILGMFGHDVWEAIKEEIMPKEIKCDG